MRNKESWRPLRAPFLTGLALGAALLLLPLAALGDAPGAPAPQPTPDLLTLPASPTPAPQPVPSPGERDAGRTLRLLGRDGQVTELAMGDYLWGVVAAEMPAAFEPEALRAQAVCARTYSLWKLAAKSHEADGADICADSSCCQAYLSREDAAQRWGEGTAGAYTAKIAAAVADTDGQVLVIHDMLGINKGFSPRFLRRYADLHTAMTDAVTHYIEDVKSCDFPNEQEQY